MANVTTALCDAVYWAVRHSIRNRVLHPDKLETWAANPREPYSGWPSRRVLQRVSVTRRDLDGRPVYEVAPRTAVGSASCGHMLYLHGGAYVLDLIPGVHWPFIARLATTLQRTVTVPIYPLAPEHTYREVFRFLDSVYARILSEHEASSVLFAGDSAGASMALALCHAVRDAGLSQPRAALLFGPWLDMGFTDPGVAAAARTDPLTNFEHLAAVSAAYAGGDPLDTPLISPGLGALDGLPALTIFTGTRDVLNPDARAFRRRALSHGVDLGWYELEGGIHCWMMYPGPDTRRTFDDIRDAFGD
jgi:acetyl esterase/lipase